MRPTSTRTLLAVVASTSLTIAGLGVAPAVAKKSQGGDGPTSGTGLVFMVNPVQSSGDQTLTDDKDAASVVPDDAYAEVTLERLDGSGYLRGDWAVVESSTGKPAYSPTGEFFYDRSEDQFEQVMAYFWVDRAQDYLQSLGFGSELDGIVDEPFAIKVGQYGGDNSYQTDKPYRIRLGKGGVDDAEDAEVIVHEYGHAIHADQAPGFGQSLDAGAIGEGFGDYFAVTVGLDAVKDLGWNVRGETEGETARGWDAEACVADWDATSYYGGEIATCLRRVDQDFGVSSEEAQGGVHSRGMVWSGALWDIRHAYEARDHLTAEDWDTTLIAAQFDFAPDTSFADAAQATYDAALERDGETAAEAVAQAFDGRGITVTQATTP